MLNFFNKTIERIPCGVSFLLFKIEIRRQLKSFKQDMADERETHFIRLPLKNAEVYYCKDFYAHETDLYDKVDRESPWKVFPVKVYDKVFDQPRLSFYMADDQRPYLYSGFDRIPEKWSPMISILREELDDAIKQINPEHPSLNAVLGNKYRDGKDNIGAHSDNETDLYKDSFIVSLSLGAERDFIFKSKFDDEKHSLKLESGSVILMGKNCQKNYKHELPKRLRIKEPRINLTFRAVKKRK